MQNRHIRQSLAVILDTTHPNSLEQECVAVEIKTTDTDIVILNAYWLPNTENKKCKELDRFIHRNNRHISLITGDFNSPHKSWGYSYTSLNCRKLEMLMTYRHMTLINDITVATQIGNSV